MNESFAQWMRYSLYRNGITQSELAGDTGLSTGYINDIAQGHRVPPIHTVKAIAGALKESPDYPAALCGYLPPSLQGITESDLEAFIGFIRKEHNVDGFTVTVFAPNGRQEHIKVGESETVGHLMVRSIAAFAYAGAIPPISADDTPDTYLMVHQAKEVPLDTPLVRFHPAVDQRAVMHLRLRAIPTDA